MSRALRRYRNRLIVERRLRQAQELMQAWNDEPPPGRLLGRWRRHAPRDCGRPQCGICRKPRYRHTRARTTAIARRQMRRVS